MLKSPFMYCLIIANIIFPIFAEGKVVTMAFSTAIPPYIFETQDKGIEIDIISAALAYKGHSLKPLYFPLGRIPIAFTNKLTDAAMGDMGVDLAPQGGFYANPAVIYDNILITLKKKNITINTPKDLDNLTVISFQGAERRYPKWLEKVDQENRFFGISDQLSQVKLLYLQRYDVALIDRNIFEYFSNLLPPNTTSEVIKHNFTKTNNNDYRPVFRDKTVRDDFNLGLKQLIHSGEMKKIYAKYINSPY